MSQQHYIPKIPQLFQHEYMESELFIFFFFFSTFDFISAQLSILTEIKDIIGWLDLTLFGYFCRRYLLMALSNILFCF